MIPIGVSHISLRYKEYNRGSGRKEEQTNNILGLTQVQKRSYVTLCICRLMLAWVTCENTTTLLVCRLIFPHCSGSHLIRLVSLLSGVDWSLRCPSPTAPSSSFVQLSDRRFLPTSGHPRSRVQNPLSGFAPKQTKESSACRTTYIVLHINFLEYTCCIIKPPKHKVKLKEPFIIFM